MEIQERKLIQKGGWFGVAVIAGSLFFQSVPITAGTAAGAIIGTANLYVIVRLVRGLLGLGPMKRWKLIALFLLKTLALFGIIGLILMRTGVNGLAFAAGFTAVVLALIWEGLIQRHA